MAKVPTGRGGGQPDDPDAIRTAMAETRAALTEKLETLRERVLGPADPAPNQGVQVMAVKKKAAAKKGAAAKKSRPAKKAAPKAKAGAAKKTAGRKTAGKKAAVTKAAATRKTSRAAKPAAKKAAARKPAKKSTTNRIVAKAKEVLSDVLVGAAGGAIQGAAQAVTPQVQQAAQTTENVASGPNPALSGGRDGEPMVTDRTTV